MHVLLTRQPLFSLSWPSLVTLPQIPYPLHHPHTFPVHTQTLSISQSLQTPACKELFYCSPNQGHLSVSSPHLDPMLPRCKLYDLPV